MMRFLLMVTGLVCGLLFFCGCDEGDHSSKAPDTAAVSFTVEWPDETAGGDTGKTEEFLTSALDCAGRGVATVAVQVNNSAGASLQAGTFDCNAHQGTLTGIPPGGLYTIIVSGLNAGGAATYRGQRTGVTLNLGPNNIGAIQVARINNQNPVAATTNSLDMTFNYIPFGTFQMGSPSDEPGRISDETQHQVTLTQGFYMQTKEVTQGQWVEVMGNNPSYFKIGDNYPVESVSWDDIQGFIANINLRGDDGTYSLPTEAQWEYAARAGSTTAFYNGGITVIDCGYDPNLNAMGWYCGNSGVSYSGCYDASGWGGPKCAGTHPVAQKTPNFWGLYDMHGNVWEWCEDWYESYPAYSIIDPTGSLTGGSRVVRGGCWYYFARGCRSADRFDRTPGYRGNDVGFRLVLLPGQ